MRRAVCATLPAMNPVHPKKLLLSKWTAVEPLGKDKHFIVARVHVPDSPEEAIEWVEIEAVYSRARSRLEWRELRDTARWRQGWV